MDDGYILLLDSNSSMSNDTWVMDKMASKWCASKTVRWWLRMDIFCRKTPTHWRPKVYLDNGQDGVPMVCISNCIWCVLCLPERLSSSVLPWGMRWQTPTESGMEDGYILLQGSNPLDIWSCWRMLTYWAVLLPLWQSKFCWVCDVEVFPCGDYRWHQDHLRMLTGLEDDADTCWRASIMKRPARQEAFRCVDCVSLAVFCANDKLTLIWSPRVK